jgi:hypothetical protein
MTANGVKCCRISIRLYPGEDDDLLTWLAEQDDHHGAKTHAIKQAWRRGIATGDAAPTPPLDLAEMRTVVEAAVATAMGRFNVAAASENDDEEEEAEQLLDALGKTLILEE